MLRKKNPLNSELNKHLHNKNQYHLTCSWVIYCYQSVDLTIIAFCSKSQWKAKSLNTTKVKYLPEIIGLVGNLVASGDDIMICAWTPKSGFSTCYYDGMMEAEAG